MADNKGNEFAEFIAEAEARDPEGFARARAEHAELSALRKDAELLAWVLAHPETAAECLEDAAAGDGTARGNLERRIAGLTQANAGGHLSAA